MNTAESTAAESTAAASTAAPAVACLPSIARRLARMMSVLMLVGLGLLSVAKYSATAMNMRADQRATLAEKSGFIHNFIADACTAGEPELLRRLALFEPVRGSTRLNLWRGDGSALFADSVPAFAHSLSTQFDVPATNVAGGKVRVLLEIDTTHDNRMLRGMLVTLTLTTLLGVATAGLAIRWLVRRELRPLLSLASQTRAISPRRLDQRLTLDRPSEELQPWVLQFNALMDRLQGAYQQLEAFNADVAHELRTPLATLIGQTELALSRERDVATLRDTLVSNLEEMQRMSALVNDMLFLSQTDRGATARRGQPVSLAALAEQVGEFHEATLEDAGLALRIEGDAQLAVDEPLLKRALSNLLGNASRFAERGSTVVVRISEAAEATRGTTDASTLGSTNGAPTDTPPQVRLTVENNGSMIAPEHLPRLFDRFFRVDASRCCEDGQHHGLGLAIVAAIARMHGGHTVAESADGHTRVGFTLAAQ